MTATMTKIIQKPLFEGDSQSRLGAQTAQLLQWPPGQLDVAADWQPVLKAFMASSPAVALAAYLQTRLAEGAVIYPSEPLRAFKLTALADVRVVILGQDPYHGSGQAEGLAFSVAKSCKIPPSLRNIYKEIQRDLGYATPAHGSLLAWAEQGVLLLNTSLTVEDGLPAYHAKKGWEALTDAAITACAQKTQAVVFMLWGTHAQSKQNLIAQHGAGRHLVLCANHPSPLSALRAPQPFIGCGHFGRARQWLQAAYVGSGSTKTPDFASPSA
jgi:uracil-DNA glycosylase